MLLLTKQIKPKETACYSVISDNRNQKDRKTCHLAFQYVYLLSMGKKPWMMAVTQNNHDVSLFFFGWEFLSFKTDSWFKKYFLMYGGPLEDS